MLIAATPHGDMHCYSCHYGSLTPTILIENNKSGRAGITQHQAVCLFGYLVSGLLNDVPTLIEIIQILCACAYALLEWHPTI